MDSLPGFGDDSSESLDEARDRAAAAGRRAAELRGEIAPTARVRRDTEEPQWTGADFRQAKEERAGQAQALANQQGIQEARRKLESVRRGIIGASDPTAELTYEEATPGIRRAIAQHEVAADRAEFERNAAGLESSGEESQVERGLDPGEVMGARQDADS